MAAAKLHFDSGARFFQDGNYSAARTEFESAYGLSKLTPLLFNIARVLDKRGRAEEAKTYYRQFIQAPLEDEAQKTKARAYVEQLEAKPAAPSSPTMIPPTASPTTTLSREQNAKPVYKKGELKSRGAT